MSATAIAAVRGRRVWDSRGRPTVEAEVRLAGGACGRAIAPAGASTGRGEAVDLRDGGGALGGRDVRRAVAHVGGEIAGAIAGLDAADQAAVDAALAALDGSEAFARIGGNAAVAVSIAAARAAAAAAGVPLWRRLLGDAVPVLPVPEVQIFGGGAHARGRIDIQDVMVVPLAAASVAEALDWCAEVYLAAGRRLAARGADAGVADEGGHWPAFARNEDAIAAAVQAIEDAGLAPGREVGIALDVAAGELRQDGRYRLARDGESLDAAAWAARLAAWIERYPIVSVEDPFADDDLEAWRRFTAAHGGRIEVVGDDLLVTDARRVRAAAEACNALLVKPNQAGTLTAARAALDAARAAGWGAIASARSGETEDVAIVHLAVGWGMPRLKVGAIARGERTAKWNEALRIEEALGADARFAAPGRLSRDRG